MNCSIRVVGDGDSGKQVIALEVVRAAKLFLSQGVGAVEVACNAERERLLRELDGRPADAPLAERGLPDSTVADARRELAPLFQLQEPPPTLIVDLRQERHPENSSIPMDANRTAGVIRVFASVWDHTTLRGRRSPESLLDITFHEMLHVCGEVQHDGIIRYNWAGAGGVKRLLGIAEG